ncbi:ATP phosphoribosyltransferase [Pikeienuella sp. HZG-20]|uniref:ATP phosphoribosyltransferase n=1 Tax=Paludibacillus litoralis TaxID=3133267 RepID=UPI0030EDA081
MSIKLGLPSKGRLQEASVAWLAARGVRIERAEAGREYAGSVIGVDGVELALLSAAEIPRELAAGRIHLGVTGEDLVREKIPGWETKIDLGRPLGFGHADLIVAVPAVWVDVETTHDLDAAAAGFRRRHGCRLRIATKYHNLARAFLTRRGVADYRLVDSQGATEATPLNLTAEAIIDITSSGETLQANHLKALEDGLILSSEARLCRSLVAPVAPADEEALAALRARIDA